MADFLVLETARAAGTSSMKVGRIVSDADFDIGALSSQGVALVAFVPATMAAPLTAFRRQRGKPGLEGDLMALLLAAGAIGGGGVTSVFGRVGPVVAASGDYSASLVTNDSAVAGTTVADALVAGRNASLSTGLVSGGVLTVNGGNPALYDVSAAVGYVVDATTTPEVPVMTRVAFAGATAQAIPLIATTEFTWIGITVAGALTLISDREPTPPETRDVIWLGVISHSGIVISVIVPRSFTPLHVAMNAADLAKAMGPFNVTGNIYTANAGANLTIDRSAGQIFFFGGGFQTDVKQPNNVDFAAVAPDPTMFYRYRDGAGGWVLSAPTAVVDPGQYDDGSGVLAAVPANRWSIQRVQLTVSGLPIIYYGQVLYNSLNSAVGAVGDDVVLDPTLDETILRTWMVVRGNTADLTDTANNQFRTAPDGVGGSQGSGTAGVTSHALLSGLAADDHLQYALADGSRGVVVIPAAEAGATLTTTSTHYNAVTECSNVAGCTVTIANTAPPVGTIMAFWASAASQAITLVAGGGITFQALQDRTLVSNGQGHAVSVLFITATDCLLIGSFA